MRPLPSLLSKFPEWAAGASHFKLAEKGMTPAEINRLAEDLVAEWQTSPELKARSLAMVGKGPKDPVSHRDLEVMVRLLHATHSKDAAANDTAALFRRAQATQKKMLPVLHREQARLDKQFNASFEPFSSVHMGINLPDEGASDIDLNVGVHDVAAFSKRLSDAGIPFTKSRDNTRVHTYNTPEGYEVELKVRPKAEVDYQIPGRGRILALPDHTKARFIKEKYDAKMSGDPDRYNAMKYRLYEEHGMIPAGGDWSSVTKKASVLGEYARHSALNLGQAARDIRYLTDHPGAPEGDGHAFESVKRRLPSLLNNLFYAAVPPHLHHEKAELAAMGGSLGDWYRRGYAPWKHAAPAAKIADAPSDSTEKQAKVALAGIEYHGKTFPGYNQPIASDKKEKKMMVLAKKGEEVRLIHFGQKGYQHNYSPEAKQNYLTRSAGIRDKSGNLTKDDPFSPNYWARKVLWPTGETGHGHNGPVNTEVRMHSEKKASSGLLSVLRSRKENEKWAAAAKLADDNPLHHVAEIGGLGVLAAPYAADLLEKRPGMIGSAARAYHMALGHGAPASVQHKMELVGLGTLAAPSAYGIGKAGVKAIKGPSQ